MKLTNRNHLKKSQLKVDEVLRKFRESGVSSSSYCIMPFVNIILEPNGDVGICRHKGVGFSFGNVQQQSIDEIWTSERVQQWRHGHLNGSADVCKTELVERKCNLCPELNSMFESADKFNVENPRILRLTANLNGKCNLECQMCFVWKLPNGFYTEENFWRPARQRFFKEIKEVDMLSGEPFIQADTFRLIDEIYSVNPDCHWSFTTNLHWQLTSGIKKHLDKIKIKNIIVSIDSLDAATFEKIRKKGSLELVKKNLSSLIDYEKERMLKARSGLNIRIHFLIQKDNWREVRAMVEFALQREIVPFISFLYEPVEYSLLDFSQDKRLEILDFYFTQLSGEEIMFLHRIIKPLIRSLDKLNYAHYLSSFKEKMRTSDP